MGRPTPTPTTRPSEDAHPAQVGNGDSWVLSGPGRSMTPVRERPRCTPARPPPCTESRHGDQNDLGVHGSGWRSVRRARSTASAGTRCRRAARTAPRSRTRIGHTARTAVSLPAPTTTYAAPEPAPTDLGEESLHQEPSRPPAPCPSHRRQRPGAPPLGRTPPVPWRSVSMTRRQDRRSRPHRRAAAAGRHAQKGAVEAATSVEPARKPQWCPPVLDDQQEGPGERATRRYSLRRNARAEKAQESLADLLGVERGGAAASASVPARSSRPLSVCSSPSPSRSPPKACGGLATSSILGDCDCDEQW